MTSVTIGMGQPLTAPTKSKVVTGAPSYALAWTFFDPVHSCAIVRALCRLGSSLVRAGRWAL
jgi:hypothetical protein